MRVAALDLGKVRVGLAITDELGLMAHPRKPLDGRNRPALLRHITLFAEEEEVERFIVGLPLDARGLEGPPARAAREFAEQVAKATGKPVELWDERFTTVEAARLLRDGGHSSRNSRDKIDGAAACVMLEGWLNRHGDARP